MTEATLSSNLQHLMRIHGNISTSELARLTEIPQPTIHHILDGSTKNPRKKALEALSKFFSISVEQLKGKTELPQIIPEYIKEDLQLRTVPIIEWDMLKNWPQSKAQMQNVKEILLDKELAPNSFALVIKDPSIELSFPMNTLLIFDSGKNPRDRDFIAACIGDDNQIVFNRLFSENNELYLKQNLGDENFQLTKLNKTTDKIIGVLVEARVQY